MTTLPVRAHCLDDLKFHPPRETHPGTCTGCTLASPTWGIERPLRRGEHIKTPGGGEGLYVGTSAHGVEIVVYDRANFRDACATFDAR